MTSIPLAFACILLVMGWKVGPQRRIDAARLKKLTSHAEGRIVESWMALDFDPARMKDHHYWRSQAKASRCIVVEYDAGWNNQIRRAFCGPGSMYSESNALEGFQSISKQVPFVWPRDERGFIVPEIRMSPAARAWLAAHAEPDPLPNDPPTKSALESLRLDFDRPIQYAVAGWVRPGGTGATLPLAFDPKDPKGARPAGFVAEGTDLEPIWLSFGIFALFFLAGGVVWAIAIAFLFGDLRKWAFWVFTIVPLIALPWWGERMPRFIGSLNSKVGDIVDMFLGDVDRWGYLSSSEPDAALLAHGERVAWRFDDSLFAGTLGRLRFTRPDPPPKSTEAAMNAFTDSVTAQVGALEPAEQAELFVLLRREKEGKLTGDGPAFLDAAHKTVSDRSASPELRRAANGFLEAWGSYFNYPEGTPPK
jgi:hypothetical protein